MLSLLIAAYLLGAAPPIGAQSTIEGSVVDAASGERLGYASIRVVDQPLGTVAAADGHFALKNVPDGVHTLEASLIAYQSRQIEIAAPQTDPQSKIVFRLEAAPISLRQLIVTPGRFSIMKKDPVVRQTLSQEDIHSIPQFGEDIYRAITRLPGVSSNDISARFTVRGGEHEEILVLLDGLELYEPFHLKDFYGGLLSAVDVMAIGGIDMMTGGFPAQYGNHLSGVFDISSTEPHPKARTAVGISFMNARFISEGQFDAGRGNWLLSARRGYLDLILKMVEGGEISPIYYDALAKVQYRLDERHTLAVNALYADDNLDAADDESGDNLGSNYGNSYTWLRLNSIFNPRLSGQTVVSVGRVSRQRRGQEFEPVFDANGRTVGNRRLEFELREDRAFTVLGLKQDWNWEVSGRQLLGAGFEVNRLDSDYDYFNRELSFAPDNSSLVHALYDTVLVAVEPDGTRLVLYLDTRRRIAAPLTAELGLRYDRLSYTGDDDLSPRLNLVYNLGKRTVLRGAWGRFHQGQDINDLDVPYGDLAFYPSQRAEHRVVGLERRFAGGLDLRLEVYQKKLTRIRPRYENLSKDVMFAPELAETSVFLAPESGDARGLEIYLKKDAGGKISWWSTYALTRAVERLDGVDVPKNQDQRHTFYLDCTYQAGRKWRFNLAWQYRSGWPYSERIFVRREVPQGEWPFVESFGPRNGVRLPAYHRLDLRLNRYFAPADGRVAVFLEIINIYNRRNVRDILPGNIRHVVDGQLIAANTVTEEWFPLLPSIGASWEF